MTPLSDLCPLLSMFKHKPVKKDSFLVYLLSPITSSLLITTSILVASFQLFGSPIRCQTPGGSSEFIEEYCWATSTFSMWSSSVSMMYPGVGQSRGEVVYHSYYQYMPVTLLLLAGLCMLPHVFWSYWEEGLMDKLVPRWPSASCTGRRLCSTPRILGTISGGTLAAIIIIAMVCVTWLLRSCAS